MQATARIPLPMRLVGAIQRRSASISTMDLAQIERNQALVLPRNPVVSLLLGGLQRGVRVAEREIAGPDAPLLLRIYTPAQARAGARPLIVYFHGGGWVLGSVQLGDWICSTVARDVDAVVVSVEYRLAPKHKFPHAVDDSYAALLWCGAHAAELGADANRIGVMGESAGGNLAAVTTLLAQAHSGPQIRHQALIYPATDLAMPFESRRVTGETLILSADDMQAFRSHYLGEGVDAMDWRLSPLHAPNHHGLPPALIVVAGHDPLYDDGVLYAEKLTAAGVAVSLKEYPAMPHGFVSFPHLARDAKAAVREVTRAQREALQC